jgi:hypothetical protein
VHASTGASQLHSDTNLARSAPCLEGYASSSDQLTPGTDKDLAFDLCQIGIVESNFGNGFESGS